MRRTIIFTPIAALLVFTAPASAAGGWSSPRTVPTAEAGASNPRVALSAGGRAVVAWERHSDSFNAIRVATEKVPLQFGETLTLSSGDESELRLTGVVSDDNGDAIVVWCSRIDGKLTVRAAQSTADGTFGPAQTLSATPARSCASVAMNAKGDALVSWSAYGQPMVAYRAAGGALGTEQSVPGPGADYPTTAAIDASGNAVLLWASAIGSDGTIRFASARRSVAGVFTPGTFVSPSYARAATGSIDYDIAADGSIAATWVLADSQSPPVQTTVSGTVIPGLGAGHVLAAEPVLNRGPLSLQARAGTAALFSRSDSVEQAGCKKVLARFMSAAGDGAPASLSLSAEQSSGWTGYPSIGGDPSSTAFAVWRKAAAATLQPGELCGRPVGGEVSTGLFSPATGLSTPVAISDPRYPASIPRASQGGRFGAAWTCFDGRKTRVQVASYGGTGEPLWCGPEDLNAPKVKVKTSRYPVRWRSSSKPSPSASCHEQCNVTVGMLMFSRGHRAAKLGVSEQALKPGRTKRLIFPTLGRGGRRLVSRAVKRRSNVRLIYRLRFDDLAGNSVLKTARVRLLP